jgi:hypothetical protein
MRALSEGGMVANVAWTSAQAPADPGQGPTPLEKYVTGHIAGCTRILSNTFDRSKGAPRRASTPSSGAPLGHGRIANLATGGLA